VLRADHGHVRGLRQVLGYGEHVAGPQGEPGEVARDFRHLDRAARDEALLGRLLGDAYAGADLAPGRA